MIDQSLLRLYGDRMPPIGGFFYNQTRTGAFSTESTNTFHYAPATVPVAQAVVDEAERLRPWQPTPPPGARSGNKWAARCLQWHRRLRPTCRRLKTSSRNETTAPHSSPVQMKGGGMGGMMGGMVNGTGCPKRGTRCRRAEKPSPGSHSTRPRRPEGSDLEEGEVPKDLAGKEADDKSVERKFSLGFACSTASARDVKAKAGEAWIDSRERFVETAYWNPSVVTDKDGKARVTFKAPSALSRYRIMARGVTGADTLVGQTTSSRDCAQGLLRRPEDPRCADPGRQAPVHRPGASPGPPRARSRSSWPSMPAGGMRSIPGTVELKGDGVDEVTLRSLRGSRRRQCPADADRSSGRAEGRGHGRDPRPALGRSGLCLGLGHQQRRHGRFRRLAQGADVREPGDDDRRSRPRSSG